MKSSFPWILFAAFTGLLSAQEAERQNFVRESASFVVTPDFAPNPNGWEVEATPAGRFRTGLPAVELLGLLENAYAEGRGGVVDFERPIYGPPLRGVDRTMLRAFVEQFEFDNPIEPYQDVVRAEFPGIPEAEVFQRARFNRQNEAIELAEATLVDHASTALIENRRDQGRLESVPNPLNDPVVFDRFSALLGPNRDIPVSFTRGTFDYIEAGGVATRGFPAARDIAGWSNAEHYPRAGVPTYAGGQARPVSGVAAYHGGAVDWQLDPRDNVVALGFVLLSYNNFQYYQSESGEIVNPDNVRVNVEFSDGSSDLLTETTQQSNGGHDMFFGIQAPEGAAITRLAVRVVGRNARTFVSIDDLVIITEAAPPYLVSVPSAEGSVGASLFYQLLVGQSPDVIDFAGLPPGLSFNAENNLIVGTPTTAGEFSATLSLANAAGATEENITFSIGPAVDPDLIPQVEPTPPISVVLRRSLPPTRVTTSRDGVAEPGELNFFAIPYRLNDDGTETPATLPGLGLSFLDGEFTGMPTSAAQVGDYRIEVYAFNQFGGTVGDVLLSIFPPIPAPNIDGDTISDIVVWNRTAGNLDALVAEGSFIDPESGAFRPGSYAFTTILNDVPASKSVHMGDFNGNLQTDFLVYDSSSGRVEVRYSDGVAGTRRVLLESMAVGLDERLLLADDLTGDGLTNLLWQENGSKRLTVWSVNGNGILWAGSLMANGGNRELVLLGDFVGEGGKVMLWRTAPDTYEMMRITSLGPVGTAAYDTLRFRMTVPGWVPYHAADLTGSGNAGLLWVNAATGAVSLWKLSGFAIPQEYWTATLEEGESPPAVLEVHPGESLFRYGSHWEILGAADFNNDQREDLILRDRRSGRLALQLVNGTMPLSLITHLPAGRELVGWGDYTGNGAADLLLRETATGNVDFYIMNGLVVSQTARLGNWQGDARAFTPSPMRDSPGPQTENLDWFGSHFFASGSLLYHFTHGWLFSFAESAASVWVYDQNLEWLWTNADTYPWLYFPRFGSWIYYDTRSVIPNRWFYESAQFAEWVMESDL